MILNTYSVITLFIAVLTALLAIFLSFSSFRLFLTLRTGLTVEERVRTENRSYLVLMVALVLLSTKLLAWPLFYVTLQSFVSSVRGAMCMFGVLQVKAGLGKAVQIVKPFVFFLIGGWLLLNRLDNATESAPLFTGKLLFLAIVSILVIADSGLEFIFFRGFTAETDVGCCTTVFDLAERRTAVIPRNFLGDGHERSLLVMYYISNLSLILYGGMYYGRSPVQTKASSHRNRHLVPLTAGVVLAALSAAITFTALFEVIAPRIMELPYHHCIYCMWQYAPSSILVTLLVILGTFSFGWGLLLYLMGRDRETMHNLVKYIRSLILFGITALTISLVVVSIHIAGSPA